MNFFKMITQEFTREGFLSFLSTVMVISLLINFSSNKKSKGNILGSGVTFLIILFIIARMKRVNMLFNFGAVIDELLASIGLIFEGILKIISNNASR